MKQFFKVALYSLAIAVCAPLVANEREVAFAGMEYGAAEVKSILQYVVGRIPDTIQYIECGDFIAAEEFKNFDAVVLVSKISRPYTAEEAAVIEAYIRQGGRLLLIQQAYRSMRESTDGDGKAGDIAHFESWLGKGRSSYLRGGMKCVVNIPEDPLLNGVLRRTSTPEWLNASVLLKNSDFENLIGHEEYILVGRKRIGAGTVYYLGSELFRMKLPQYKERHADAESWGLLIENILTDSSSAEKR